MNLLFAIAFCWTLSQDPSVTGYRLHFGEKPRQYTQSQTSNTNRIEISGLTTGKLYHFAVTAYDGSGLESDYSEEISYVIPRMGISPTGAPRVWRPINRKNVRFILLSKEFLTDSQWIDDPATETILQVDTENNMELVEYVSAFPTPTRFFKMRLDIERPECAN